MMILEGKAHRFADNINTDEIIAARYLNSTDPLELGRHCMESIDADFVKKINNGDIIVAGKNFGCGSSREHAPLAIKGAGISCVIAYSFARIFFRNAINIGLPIFELRQARQIRQGDKLQVDLIRGLVTDLSTNKVYSSATFPEFMRQIIKSGGLINWTRTVIRKK
jgi:3-isopropylmalate/(R)-2-methylmalate dehydratase small subunit